MPPGLDDLDPARLRAITLLILDCDGVLTDGRVFIDAQGRQSKAFSVIDGYGLVLLRKLGVTLAMVTKDPSTIPQARGEKLGFHYIFRGVDDKGPCVEALLRKLEVSKASAAYVGDDLPDLGAFIEVGTTFAPASARPEVLAAADAVTHEVAGHGAVRAICDAIRYAKTQK